jgi:excisionase family DNA binding protein
MPDPGSTSDPLLTAAEVAELLRVDVYSVRRWTRRGELTAYRVGRELRIPTSAIDTFLGARRTAALS